MLRDSCTNRAVLSAERWEVGAVEQVTEYRVHPAGDAALAGRCLWVDRFVRCYDDERLRGAVGYVTPKDKLRVRENEIFAEHRQVGRSAPEKKFGKQAGRC